MGSTSAYLSAVVAGAMTAGIGAANVLAVPPDTVVPAQSTSDVDLAAYIQIPIIDIGPTPGPLSIWRQLAIEAGTNPLLLGLIQNAGNTYDLPGLTTTVDSDTHWRVLAERGVDYIDFGAASEQGQLGSWDVLGVFGSSADVDGDRNIHFRPLLGGAGGIGAALYGTLGHSTTTRSLQLFDSGLDAVGKRTVGDFNGELALMPFDGFKAVGDGTAIDAHPDADFNLGSLTGSAGGNGRLSGDIGLCLGSAQASCGGRTAFLTVGAPVDGGLTLGGNNIISGDFSTNEVAVELKDRQFSAQGAIGGTVKIGNLEIGRPIPIDIQIPRTTSLVNTATSRQQSTVRNSLFASPRKSFSGNDTGGKHRAPLRDAIDNVKTAVNNLTQPKHAKADTED